MTSAQRRDAILQQLHTSEKPISATALAAQLGVSRQVIVGDVALLRAGGVDIQATPRGYVMGADRPGITAVLPCVHSREDMARELYIMVDHGAEVLDVSVEHPVYGQLTGQLLLRSRYDVDQFLAKAEGCAPLSALTGGIHLHTVRCPDEDTLHRVTSTLQTEGYLLPQED